MEDQTAVVYGGGGLAGQFSSGIGVVNGEQWMRAGKIRKVKATGLSDELNTEGK